MHMMHDIAFLQTMVCLALYAIGVLISMFTLRKTIVYFATRDVRKELKSETIV